MAKLAKAKMKGRDLVKRTETWVTTPIKAKVKGRSRSKAKKETPRATSNAQQQPDRSKSKSKSPEDLADIRKSKPRISKNAKSPRAGGTSQHKSSKKKK